MVKKPLWGVNGLSPVHITGSSGPKATISSGIGIITNSGTLNLANGQYNGADNTNITIDKNMTIKGENRKKTIINGNGINWLFSINNGIKVTIEDLTLTHSNGGAIYDEGNLTVNNCDFINNTADSGAAISFYGTVTDSITNTTFTNNTVNYFGGAISFDGDGGTVINSIANSTFTNNTSQHEGGAIYSYSNGGTITNTLTKTTFTNNTAHYYGGAIESDVDGPGVFEGAITDSITKTTFTNNTAGFGGAINNGGAYDTIINCLFSNNIANSTPDNMGFGPNFAGGAINNGGILYSTNNIFTNNTSIFG